MSETTSSAPAETSAPVQAPETNSTPSLETQIENKVNANTAPAAPTVTEAKAEAIQAKVENGEKLTKTEVNQLKEYEIKVFGKTQKIKFDPSNDEEVVKFLQKGHAADKSMQESAELRKATMDFISELKKNPAKVLADPSIGLDIRKFAQEILTKEVEDLEKSPEQREKEALKQELEELKAAQKDREEKGKAAEFSRLQAEQEQILETQITTALDMGGLPKTPRTVRMFADLMSMALENNIDLSPSDIAPIVKNSTMSEFKEIVASLSDDQLDDFLGKEILGKIRKRNVSKAKEAIATAKTVKDTGRAVEAKKAAAPAQKLSIKQFLGV